MGIDIPPNLQQSIDAVAGRMPASVPQPNEKVIRDKLRDEINARLAEKNNTSQS